MSDLVSEETGFVGLLSDELSLRIQLAREKFYLVKYHGIMERGLTLLGYSHVEELDHSTSAYYRQFYKATPLNLRTQTFVWNIHEGQTLGKNPLQK